jgi:hypothetical protein
MRMHKLMDGGRTWEEADEVLNRIAQDELDAERDMRLLEYFEEIRKSRALEDFDQNPEK